MNDNPHEKEYSEEDIQRLLKRSSGSIRPPEALLTSVLRKIPAKNLPSPYGSKARGFVFSFRKMSFAIAMVAVIAVGGAAYVHFKSSSAPSAATADLGSQLAAIDNQMSGLNMDASTVDQALNYRP